MYYLTFPALAVAFWLAHLWRQLGSRGALRATDVYLGMSAVMLACGSVGLFLLARVLYPVGRTDVYQPDEMWLIIAVGLSMVVGIGLCLLEVILRLVFLWRGRG